MILYRLLKVVYFCLIFITIIIAFSVLWSYKPERILDYVQINCFGGKSYNSDSQGIYLYSEYVSDSDDGKIRYLCADEVVKLRNIRTGEVKEVLKDTISPLDYNNKLKKNYSLSFKYKIRGDWFTSIVYFVLVLIIGFVILEIIKRTLRYIFVGKSFFT